jgi:hypothetical protein
MTEKKLIKGQELLKKIKLIKRVRSHFLDNKISNEGQEVPISGDEARKALKRF